ncbi:MAG: hypothetical protein ACRD2O_06290, partial [Terriglobia bacterium]
MEQFFAQFRDSKTGANLRGWNGDEKPEDFRQQFTCHLRILVEQLLNAPSPPLTATRLTSTGT